MEHQVNRKVLDFDFEKICSVTLSTLNVYACLGCGKFFQGRSEGSPAYMHALHQNHQLFINLKTLKVYSLPDNVEFNDNSGLDDVRSVIKAKFTCDILDEIDKNVRVFTDLHGKTFLPGFIGLNNIKANDFVNVILQAFAHIKPLRNYFLLNFNRDGRGELLCSFGDVLEKIWNPFRFKAQTSPHEFLQSVSNASRKRFSLVQQGDPIEFLSWFINTNSKECSIFSELFQGRVRIDSCDFVSGREREIITFSSSMNMNMKMQSDEKPFYYLTLDLPPKPLFQDPRNPTAIPQINLSTLLEKFNSGNFTYRQTKASAFTIKSYPKYLILHVNRFVKNNFVVEHNPTIVNFSPDSISFPVGDEVMMSDDSESRVRYNLLANIYCIASDDGGEADENKKSKSFGVHLKCPATGIWLEIENLVVRETQAQLLFMSESYIQIWEQE